MAIQQKSEELGTLISDLQKQRKEHEEAIAKIDETFATYGISAKSGGKKSGGTSASSSSSSDSSAPSKRRGPGRPKGSTNKKKKATGAKKRGGRRSRGSFDKTGEESVLDFIRSQPNPPNAKQVNQHWQEEGRGGKADNTISKMVKGGQLERVDVEGERGGRYKAAS